jgi:hypothetical protein
MVIKRHQELQKLGMTNALVNYEREMKERIEFWLNETDKGRRVSIPDATTLDGQKVTRALYDRRMLSGRWYNSLEENKEARPGEKPDYVEGYTPPAKG